MSDDICPICYYELNNSSYEELDCEHKFCNDCLCRYIKNKIDDRETKIYCPIDSCDKKITLSTIESLVDDEDIVDKYKKYRSYDDMDLNKHSMCPMCQNICQKEENSDQVYCETCSEDYCFVCHENHYDYDDCPNESKINSTISEIISALNNENIKLCPICKIIIEKNNGCSSMRCKYCKVKFCWHCLQTNSIIMNMENHDCLNYAGFDQTYSDDEYVDGFDD
jgi:E3 ubiquitin-protein ligase RNF144